MLCGASKQKKKKKKKLKCKKEYSSMGDMSFKKRNRFQSWIEQHI